MSKLHWILLVCMTLGQFSCSAYKISRIGPTLAPRTVGCHIEILEEGQLPPRPYRDVGIVELQHCPDYRSGSCRKWVRQAACEVGGDVVYRDRSEREEYEFNQVVFRLTVAAYVASIQSRSLEDEPCSPACREGSQCISGLCVERTTVERTTNDGVDCDKTVVPGKDNHAEDPPERCLE